MNHAQELNKIIESASASFGGNKPQALGNSPVVPKTNVFFTTSVLGMKAVSHVIEDQALKSTSNLRFYSAFQKFSRAKQQKERYDKLSETGNPIFVFGVPDVSLWQNSQLKPVPIDDNITPNLAQNWFVVLHDPQLVSMALLSRELPSTSRPSSSAGRLVYRNFEGFWTYDAAIIGKVVTILDDYINGSQGGK